MHLHLVREPARSERQRPAKVVVLEARRQARLEQRAAEKSLPPRAA